MSTIEILALFVVFGAICARYVSVVGFALTAILIAAVVAVIPLLFDAGVSVRMLIGTFIALQVGYFVGLVAAALFRHFSRLYAKDPRQVEDGKLHVHHD